MNILGISYAPAILTSASYIYAVDPSLPLNQQDGKLSRAAFAAGISQELNLTGAATMTLPVSVANGGTGANSAGSALTNLGAAASNQPTVISPLTVNGATGAAININDTSGTNVSNLAFKSNGSFEWVLQKNGTNNFLVERYVAGTFTDNPISIAQATGITTFTQRPVFGTATPWDSANLPNPGGGGRLLAIRLFTTSQTYTATAGTNSVLFKVQAAGGGGAGVPATSTSQILVGCSGMAGDYSEHYMTSGFNGLAMTIGAGGAAGAVGGVGGAGGDTSLGTVVVLRGGLGGATAASTTAAVAQLAGSRTAGTPGNLYSKSGELPTPGFGIVNQFAVCGPGGNSPFGSGGRPGSNNNAGTTPGSPGTGYGAGGGGSNFVGSAFAGVTGGAGSQGVIMAVEYS